ncbi:MAG: hypothetical protein PHT07_24095 [Paludibacter sp.]|nr:hypothetical protein [Paludibacter sp.]
MKKNVIVSPLKAVLAGLLIVSTVANAGGFVRHAMLIGTGFAIGHAAGKAIDYGIDQYKSNHSDQNRTKR